MSYQQYPQRDAVKNYFPLPNEIFSLDLTTGELAVYAYLLYTIRPIQEAVDCKNERQLAKADAARERHRVQKLLAKQRPQVKHVDAVLAESSGESLL